MSTPGRPAIHEDRLERALLSLEGLSLGDAFGGKFFTPTGRDRAVPPPVWRYSDDTEMSQDGVTRDGEGHPAASG